MSSSSADGFPKKVFESEAEWRLLLTAVAGPFRSCFGNGPTQVRIAPGPTVRAVIAKGATRHNKQPAYIRVQVAPGSPAPVVVFSRNQNPTPDNGVVHDFGAEPVFEQIVMPSDQLYVLLLSLVPATLLSTEVVV